MTQHANNSLEPNLDITKPPLTINAGISRAAVENLTRVWQSWPEHFRHLILHGGVKFEFKQNCPSVTAVERSAQDKVVELNAEIFAKWNSATQISTEREKQDLIYSEAMYAAALLAEPRLSEDIDWNPSRREYQKRMPESGSIAEILSAAYSAQQIAVRSLKGELADSAIDGREALRQFDEQAVQIAYETVPALKSRYGEIVVNEMPRIVTNVRDNGPVEQQDIDRFKQVYAGWPKKYKALIEASNVTFELVSTGSNLVRQYEPEKIYVATQMLDPKQYKSGTRHAGKNIAFSGEIDKLMIQSLLAAFGEKKSELNWQPAIQEAQILQRQHQAQGQDTLKDFARPDLILLDGYRKASGRVEAIKVCDAYMALVDKEYEKMQREQKARIAAEREAKYQATDTQFVINDEPDVLTPPQQKYFEKLNEIIKLLGVSPKEFDTSFRISSYHQIRTTGYDAALHAMKLVAEKRGRDPATIRLDKKLYENEPAIKVQSVRLEGKPSAEILDPQRSDLGLFNSTTEQVAITILDPYLGIHKIDWASRNTNEHNEMARKHDLAVDAMAEAQKGVDLSRSCGEWFKEEKSPAKDACVIQKYANGSISINVLDQCIPTLTFNGDAFNNPDVVKRTMPRNIMKGICVLPPATEYFRSSIHNAALDIIAEQLSAGRLDDSKAAQIKDELIKLEDLWTHAVKTPQQYQQYEVDEAARLLQEQLNEQATLKANAENLAKQTAEELRIARLPEAYIITSPAYGRIVKAAAADINPARTSHDVQLLAENMRVARDMVVAFTRAGNMDAKIPEHKALGDALLNDAVFARLEYAFKPSNGNGTAAIDAALQTQMRQALQSVYVLNKATTALSPERAATNERLKRLIEKSPALVIAALGSTSQVQQLRKLTQRIYTDKGVEQPPKEGEHRHPQMVIKEGQCELRDQAYDLLTEAGVVVTRPPLEVVSITTGGHVFITEREFAPPLSETLLTLTQDELNTSSIIHKIENDLSARLKELRLEAGRFARKDLLAQYQSLEDQLIAIAVNEKDAREGFLYHTGTAFAAGRNTSVSLNDASIPPLPLPPEEPELPQNIPGYCRPLSECVMLANDFVQRGLARDHTLFCCHVDPAGERDNPVVLKMYRWGMDGDRLTVQRPPMVRRINTGQSLDHAREVMQQIQIPVLRMPNITAYARLNDPPDMAGGDVLIPNQQPINGQMIEGHWHPGELIRRGGMYELHLEYGAPQSAELDLKLGYTQGGQNYHLARLRAQYALQYIENMQAPGNIVTRDEVEEHLRQRFVWQSPTAHGHTMDRDVAFPAGEITTMRFGSPRLLGYPEESWKSDVTFIYNGHELASYTLHLNTRNLQTALQCRQQTADAMQLLLQHESDRAIWDLLDNHTLNTIARRPLEGPPHDLVDQVRLRSMIEMAASYEACYQPAVSRQERFADGRYAVTFGLRRMHRGQPEDGWFYENTGHIVPQELQRTVIFPAATTRIPEVAALRVAALESRVQQLLQRYLLEDYTSFTAADADGVQQMRHPKTFNSYSYANSLSRAIEDACCGNDITDDPDRRRRVAEMFAGCELRLHSPRHRASGGNGNGNSEPPFPGNGVQHHDAVRTVISEFNDDGFTGRYGKRAVREGYKGM